MSLSSPSNLNKHTAQSKGSLLQQMISRYAKHGQRIDEALVQTVEWAVARHGRLDVLCNNAGVLGRQTRAAKSILSFYAGEFDRVLRVNELGAALGMKHATLAMAPRRAGSIVSVAGVLGGLGPHAYTASKHTIVGLTKNASCELGAHGIRIVGPRASVVVRPLRCRARTHRCTAHAHSRATRSSRRVARVHSRTARAHLSSANQRAARASSDRRTARRRRIATAPDRARATRARTAPLASSSAACARPCPSRMASRMVRTARVWRRP